MAGFTKKFVKRELIITLKSHNNNFPSVVFTLLRCVYGCLWPACACVRVWAYIYIYIYKAPFAFHTWCFPFALICHWISIVFLLYGRRITTHSVDPPLTHFLGEFPGLGLALVPDVVVPQAEQR